MKPRREGLLAAAAGIAALLAFRAIFIGFFPSPNGRIGHDYGYFFPQLLNGYYWFRLNGPFAVPWFTPALGGGVPFYPNPTNVYYSLPQLLALFLDPLAAVRANLLLFAALGYAGAWVLLRRGLALGPWSALLGAVLFLFNGFYAARMLVGHVAFHSIMLLPWIAWLLLRPLPERGRLRRALFDCLAAGALFAYMYQSAYFYGVPVTVGAAACLGLLGSLRRPGSIGAASFLGRLAGSAAVSLLLCCSKLAAASAFLANFPRTGYPLPGLRDVGTALAVLARAFFWYAPHRAHETAMENLEYSLARHEFELGVTPVAAALIALGALVGSARLLRGSARGRWPAAAPKLLLLAALLAVPFAVNVYEPGWNAFLKKIPMLESTSSPLRYLALYIPVWIALAALALESLPGRARPALALAGILVVPLFASRDDRSAYASEIYDPRPVVEAWHAVHAGAAPPPVTAMTAPLDAQNRPLPLTIDRNDALIRGESQLICYEPIFGFQLESLFDLHALMVGPAELRTAEGYNARNPALFVFPEENSGAPGDPFRPDQLAEMRLFLGYRPFPFAKSALQRVADALNLVTLLLAAAALASYPWWRPRGP